MTIALWLLCVLGAADTDATQTASTLAPGWVDLASPFFAVRSRAQLRLRHLPGDEGARIVAPLVRSEDPVLRRVAAEWCFLAIEEALADVSVDDLVAAVERETDAAVRDQWIRALAVHPRGVDKVRDAFLADRVSGWVLDELIEARVVVLFKDIMHDGGVPGFFDGQFANLHALDPTVYGRLVRIAWDAQLHFVVRALSIMALHEPRREDLEAYLQPILIPARSEVMIMRDTDLRQLFKDMDDVAWQRDMLARISQYARFSLAKAGIDGPIRAKIEELNSAAERELANAMGSSLVREDGGASILLERAVTYLFEVGYHYQQLDEYEAAASAYQRIISRPEPVGSKCWAHYNLACIRSIQGDIDGALDHLTRAFSVDNGMRDASWAMRDGDLEPLWGDERFQRLVTDMQRGVRPKPSESESPDDE